MDRNQIMRHLERYSKLVDETDIRSFIDAYLSNSFYIDPDAIKSDGEYSFISQVTRILGERSLDRDGRTIRYAKLVLGNRITFTLWNEEIERYFEMLAEGRNYRFIFCSIRFTRFGIEGSLGLRGFILNY
ncbi:hypothetical protein DMB44_03000 [Thermoplasma sp. Kam2015]|uniref:hypothetical protein n=1 Tax=Thermoplasma sp. Kam2015 TaxID=2094122 RepID=UPI000D9872A7|nr:hypothetical protein [Thermoplasma sp. Kam2015]PYB68589.1 hypothetical protein DMB44_03000 [Thermoplasma sp. Kam2015]